ncbi:c-type cytochrome [Litorisediminicola beolgyonensis]|uniref:C-type cytochrome n=1 Tax=Litorisediminicola beolgyonensis TaxID=1173614 RepID=A0ABW3ZLZ6_9RHOB
MRTSAHLLALSIIALAGTTATADEMGQTDFMEGCAGCHGESGKGQGPLAELLNVAIPDLTQLSAGNDGVFPMLKVIHTIDGRTSLKAHGGPMPIWGTVFKSHAASASGVYGGPEAVTRGRILSIAYYLESIQE